MGISGLLPLLKDIQESRNISDFRGKRLAIDAYVWLHKGAFGCAEDLVKGKKTTRFVDYAMHRIGMLQHHGIAPFVVFDGGPLPAKRCTEDSREKSRVDNLARAQAFEAQGRYKEARDCYTKCLDITPEMAFQLIKALRAAGVDYVVAPYEADAQLCFLEREGFVDGVITEDSDLLVFGCKLVIFKLEKNGSCVSIDRSKLAKARGLPMHGWTDVQFRRMAMLSGCDYLPSIPGIGLKKAHGLLRRFKTVEKSLQSIRLDGSHTIPPGYLGAFQQAELAFLYQRVFCPEERRLVPLNPFPDSGLQEDDEKWIGLDLDIEVAQGMAAGDIHPETREPIVDLWPDFQPAQKPGTKPPPAKSSLLGYFTKTKRTKAAPAVQPVGQMASGPSRLSDLPHSRRHAPQSPPPPAVPKVSKFFGKSAPSTQKSTYDLKWEDSDAIPTQVELPKSRSPSPVDLPTPSRIRSPSPFLSTAHPSSSPPHGLTTPGRNNLPVTSPFSHVSSPTTATPPDSLDRALDAQHSDRGTSPFPPEPTSPTPTRVLVAASSQRATFASTPGAYLPSSQMATIASSVPATPIRPRMKSLTSVLVPSSSPSLQPTRATKSSQRSSDSATEDDIVTPSADVAPKRAPGKRPREVDTDPESQARAQSVAQGWRSRWSLGSTDRLPLSAAAPRILADRSLNIDCKSASLKPSKPSVPAVPDLSANAHGLSWSALERFRFSRG